MARTKEFDPEAAVDAAMQLFWRQGYEATSVDDLVAHLGVGRGSLYATFGSKHALYLRALERYRHDRMGAALAALEGGSPVREALRALFDGIVADALRDGERRGCFMVNATTERASRDAAVARCARENALAMETSMRRALERAQRAGEIPAGRDPRALARFLVMAVQGLRVASKATPSRATLEDMVDVTLAALD